MNLLSYIKKFDWIILGAIIALVFLGAISIYSSSLITQDFTDLYKQLGFLGVSIILMVIVSFFDYRKLRENSTLIMLFYIISIGLLIGVLFMPTIRDTASWYRIGPFNFDPIEPTKLALILLLAKFFSRRHR